MTPLVCKGPLGYFCSLSPAVLSGTLSSFIQPICCSWWFRTPLQGISHFVWTDFFISDNSKDHTSFGGKEEIARGRLMGKAFSLPNPLQLGFKLSNLQINSSLGECGKFSELFTLFLYSFKTTNTILKHTKCQTLFRLSQCTNDLFTIQSIYK